MARRHSGTLDPLGDEGPQRLGELCGWLFGPGRVIKDSRQIDDIGKVVSDEASLGMLKEHKDLTVALQELPPDWEAVFNAIRTAFRELARANGLAVPPRTRTAERVISPSPSARRVAGIPSRARATRTWPAAAEKAIRNRWANQEEINRYPSRR